MPAEMRKRKRRVPPPEPETPKRARVSIPPGGKMHNKQATDPDSRPQNVSFRLGKRWSQIVTEVRQGQYTWDEFVEELSPEELARGQLKDLNGRFQGRPPAMVPRQFQLACVKEIQSRFNEKIQERLLDAVDEMVELSRVGGGLEGKDRAKLLIYLIERVMGPVPKQVVIAGADEPWQGMMTAGFIRPGASKDEPSAPTAPPRSHDRYSKRRKKIDASEDVDD